MPSPPATAFPHRLRGLVDGMEKTFHLEPGEHRVGSSRSNDVALPLRGISREHAVLTVGPEGVEVEDRGSLNGTFVDERRVETAAVPSGAELRFGPVRLRLERLEPADAELAIVVELPAGLSPEDPWPHRGGDDTTQLASAHSAVPRETTLVLPDGYLTLRSPSMTAVYRQMESLAGNPLPVLILGETGVGKELVARILHLSSADRTGSFVAVNCAAIPAELLEAEMFGIDKGVATGVEKRPGRFEQAQLGTLFLDEIGEMAPALQAKLLRAVQEKEIQPVGGRPKKIDVRIVAATNAELSERMAAGLFRRDLYYRLAGSVLSMAPLRECRDDVPRLVKHFLQAFCRETGKRIRGVTVGALDQLTAYAWPGNVRQLESEVRRLVYQCQVYQRHGGQVIDSAALSPEVRGDGAASDSRAGIALEPRSLESLALEPRLRQVETCLIREALRRTGGNRTRAADLLGITRNGLAKKLKRLEL